MTVWVGTNAATRKVAQIRKAPPRHALLLDARPGVRHAVRNGETSSDPAEKAKQWKSEFGLLQGPVSRSGFRAAQGEGAQARDRQREPRPPQRPQDVVPLRPRIPAGPGLRRRMIPAFADGPNPASTGRDSSEVSFCPPGGSRESWSSLYPPRDARARRRRRNAHSSRRASRSSGRLPSRRSTS